MANHKYSHALVLSHFEDSGLLNHDPRRRTPSRSPFSSEFRRPKPRIITEIVSPLPTPPHVSEPYFAKHHLEPSNLQLQSDSAQPAQDSLTRSDSVVTQIYAPGRPAAPNLEKQHASRLQIPRTASKHWEPELPSRSASKESKAVREAHASSDQALYENGRTSMSAYEASNSLPGYGAKEADVKLANDEKYVQELIAAVGAAPTQDESQESLENGEDHQQPSREPLRYSTHPTAPDTLCRASGKFTQASKSEEATGTKISLSEPVALSERVVLDSPIVSTGTPTPAPLKILRNNDNEQKIEKPLPDLPSRQHSGHSSRPPRYRTRGFASPSRYAWTSNGPPYQTSTSDALAKPVHKTAPPYEPSIKTEALSRTTQHATEHSKSRPNSDGPSSGTGSSNATSASHRQSNPSPQTTPPTSPTLASLSSLFSTLSAEADEQSRKVPIHNKDMAILPWEHDIGMGPSIFCISAPPPAPQQQGQHQQQEQSEQQRALSPTSSIDDAIPPPIPRVRRFSKNPPPPPPKTHRPSFSKPATSPPLSPPSKPHRPSFSLKPSPPSIIRYEHTVPGLEPIPTTQRVAPPRKDLVVKRKGKARGGEESKVLRDVFGVGVGKGKGVWGRGRLWLGG